MGNAASCKPCGSGRSLKTKGDDGDSDQQSDYYKVADSGSDMDDILVRVKVRIVTFIFSDVVLQ